MRTRSVLALVVAVASTAALGPVLPATGSAAKTVKVGDDFFSPSRLNVRRGAVVRWRWVGQEGHNVVVTRGPVKFKAHTRTHGSYSHRFTRRGRYTIVCTIHGFSMRVRVR